MNKQRIPYFRKFSRALSDAMVSEWHTPRTLASESGVDLDRVISWLETRSLPSAAALWAITEAIPNARRELFSAAVACHLASYNTFRPMQHLPGPSWNMAAASYFHPLLRNSLAGDRAEIRRVYLQFIDIAPRVPTPAHEPKSGDSKLVLLPEPSVWVVDHWRELTQEIASRIRDPAELPWKAFEDLVAYLLERNGWRITPMGYTKDGGIDLIAARTIQPSLDFTMMIQCKRQSPSNKVGLSVVREVWSVKWKHGFHQAMIATTSEFTRGAKLQGQEWKLTLADHDAIVQWCKQCPSAA